jgi:predicted ATPase/DNA-binding winged helix-turn-helix (wHTH) protein
MLVDVEGREAVLLRFAGCELDLDRFDLRRDGVRCALEPQAFDVLAYLVAHRDRVVSKGELLDNVWGDRFVSESTLSTRIKQVRRAVGDDGRRQEVIETVHGRGFRFVAGVDVLPRPAHPHVTVAGPGRPLRRPASTFVGRADDLGQLTALIGERRLLTICGPGGVGKSRLAQELAAAVASRWSDGVRVLDLAEMPARTDLIAAVAESAGVRDRSGEDLLDRLVDACASRQMLLLLDDCEHLVDQVARMVDALVGGTAGISVLATSRVPLEVDGEQLWPLRPLDTDTSDSATPPAVQLFLDRAAGLARPEWIAQLDRVAVHALCQRLDGMPLGIELAASRARHRGIRAVLDELDDPAGPDATSAGGDRHSSMDSVLSWSYDRLAPDDQRLFETCSTFASAFDAASLAEVAGAGRSTEATVDGLSRLVDQSMVTVDTVDGEVRFRLLTPLRELGRRRAAGHHQVDRQRHARWASDRLADLASSLRGRSAGAALDAYENHLPELRAARDAVVAQGAHHELARICEHGFWFAQERSHTDVLGWGRPLLDAADSTDEQRALAHVTLAAAEWQRGDLSAARQHAAAGVGGACDPAVRGLALLVDAEVRQLDGDHETVIAQAGTLSALAERGDDPLLGTIADVAASLSLAALGRTGDAQARAAVATEIARGSGSPLARAWASYAEGESRAEGEPSVALVHLERAWALARVTGARLLSGVAGLSVVSVRARSRGADASLADFAEVIDHWSRAGTAVHQWSTIRNLLPPLAERRHDEAAASLYGAIVDGGRGPVAHGPEASRLQVAVAAVEERLGAARFAALAAEGSTWTDAGVVARARAACTAELDGGVSRPGVAIARVRENNTPLPPPEKPRPRHALRAGDPATLRVEQAEDRETRAGAHHRT